MCFVNCKAFKTNFAYFYNSLYMLYRPLNISILKHNSGNNMKAEPILNQIATLVKEEQYRCPLKFHFLRGVPIEEKKCMWNWRAYFENKKLKGFVEGSPGLMLSGVNRYGSWVVLSITLKVFRKNTLNNGNNSSPKKRLHLFSSSKV